ncbi:hypothetical protein SE17_00165 [Kouleothrix aurantiaca]|uniref:Uncharacterized protein n=1 Tax=Kouleothrix aurantiaca TaxID=186479 RepID=A0A0P9FNX6_9CHLR|nr:hypothetical protein SE17_00165 [Kouleothrix aurantiaca]
MIGVGRGVSRTAILIGPYAIKVPSFRHGARYFVMGMLGNILERDHWRMSHHPQLAPVYACGPLGLWLVMKRYTVVLDRLLTPEEQASFPFMNIDNNGANVASDNGKLVLIDYGNTGWYLVVDPLQDMEEL